MTAVASLQGELYLMPPAAFTHEQVFTSPGTWTCPATTTYVEVIAVGGGGGGGSSTSTGSNWTEAGSGGGGAVRRKWIPVSGPVPVTVGAGGTAGNQPTIATAGGTSAFGPLTPPVPALTFVAGGGGAGGNGLPAQQPQMDGTSAPTDGGGGGGSGRGSGGSPPTGVNWGYWGAPSYGKYGGGARSMSDKNGPRGYGCFGGAGNAFGNNPLTPFTQQWTIAFGGGYSTPAPIGPSDSRNGAANRGGGGAAGQVTSTPAGPAGTISAGGAGGSGVVIVRWKE